MEDWELYQAILGLSEPWTVERVELKGGHWVRLPRVRYPGGHLKLPHL